MSADVTTQTYLTVPEARDYLRFDSDKAVYCWASTYRIPKLRRGKIILFRRRDLDLAIAGELKRPRQSMSLVHGDSIAQSSRSVK